MNKKLIAVALAALPVAAMADATLYGSIRAGVTSYDGQKNGFKSTTGVEDFSSRIGFKGAEDLGNGLKAIWQVENGFRIDGTSSTGSSSGTFANRQSFVGLENAQFGKVRLGYLDDALKATEATDIWIGARQSGDIEFPLYETIAKDSTLKNSVRYDSPDFMGFNFMAIHGFDEDKQTNANQQQKGVTGARIGYSNAGFFAGLAYQQKANTGTDQSETNRTWRLEGGYKANNLYLAATAEQVKAYDVNAATNAILGQTTAATGDEVKVQDYALAASYTMGAITPKVSYSWSRDVEVNGDKESNTGAKQFAVGVDYAASKRTTLFAQYAQVKYDKEITVSGVSDDKDRIYAVGVRHNF